MSTEQSERLTVTYTLRGHTGEAAARALDIAYEQTCELPPALVAAPLAALHAGQVQDVAITGARQARVTVSYPAGDLDNDITQVLGLLYGNISLKPGICVQAISWPVGLLRALGGPAFGIAGLRALTGVRSRALLSTALKPVGLSARELAARAGAFARGGIDLIKDDHGLHDQPSAPFAQRLARCQEAVQEAGQHDGHQSLYLPNVTARPDTLLERAALAKAAGCRAVLLCPWAVGLGALQGVRDMGLAIMAHPGLTGAYFGPHAGIAPALLLGDVFRLAGADAVIYPNTGGRFNLSARTCQAINTHLRQPLGDLHPSMPAPAGGMDVARAGHWVGRYGADTILLIGASLYAQRDLTAAAAQLRRTVETLA